MYRPRFRFGLRSLLLMMLIASALCGYYAWNAKHYAAIKNLVAEGNSVQWKRVTPTWVDRILGVYRFDSVKLVRIDNPESNLGSISDLHSLEEFHSNHTHNDFSPLFPHADTIRVFQLNSSSHLASEFLIKTENLEVFACNTWQQFDLAWLAANKNLKSLHITNIVGGIEHLANFKELEYLNTPFELNSLEPIRGMKQLKHLSFSSAGIRSLEPIKDLKLLRTLYFECPIPQQEIDAFIASLPETVSAEGYSVLSEVVRE